MNAHADSRSFASPAVLPVVCLAVGDVHGQAEVYVQRLFDMLARHCPQPFILHCYSDRPRSLPPGVVWRDCSAWTELDRDGLRRTTRKLGFFNPAYVEFEAFFYFDLSLVIRRDIGELIAAAFARPEALVILDNWHYDGYNSSVMRLRRGPLRAVYDAFVAGENHVQRVPGDQDFIHGVVATHGLASRVAKFPPGQVISFKKTIELGKRDAALARRRIAEAMIVKFHGRPKMDEAFGRRYCWPLRLREILRGDFRTVMPVGDLRRQWEGVVRS